MIILTKTALDPSPVAIVDALRRAFPGASIRVLEFPQREAEPCTYNIEVSPVGESSFSVSQGSDNLGFSLDALDSQNARAIVAIMSVITGIAPVILVDPDRSSYIDLTSGMTSVDLQNSWRSWDDLDPEIWS